jgi:hypothetical protein
MGSDIPLIGSASESCHVLTEIAHGAMVLTSELDAARVLDLQWHPGAIWLVFPLQ